jgi:hypothetical protein
MSGYYGKNCQFSCNCSGHDSCLSDGSCDCDIGYEWSNANRSCIPSCRTGDCDSPGRASCSSCIYGTCLDGTCVCWAGYAGVSCIQVVSRANNGTQIGTNLNGISYYSREWAFVDAMKYSMEWISLNYPGMYSSNSWGNGMEIHLRSDGYPTYLQTGQIVATLTLRDVCYHAPAGRYVCLYDGNGVLDFGFDATVISVSKNRIEFDFTPTCVVGCTAAYCSDNGIFLQILETDVTNPVHNIRIIMPGFEYQYDVMPFHPWFLKSLEHYSTIRFMTWQNINSNTEIYWANRTTTDHVSQAASGRGVALEHMIQLSNTLGSNPWFCMPHQANDDYIRNFAIMVRDTLRPDVKVGSVSYLLLATQLICPPPSPSILHTRSRYT